MPSFLQNGLTNIRTSANAAASRMAASLLPAPNGPSNQTAPNAQAAAMRPTTAQSIPPSQNIGDRLISVMERISYEVVIEGGVGVGHRFSRRYATRHSFFYRNPAMNRR